MAKKNIDETVETVEVKETVETVEETKKETVDDTEKIKEEFAELKTAVKKVARTAKKIAEEKGKDAVEKTKSTTKKMVDTFKKATIHTYIQIDGKEIDADKIVERIKEDYKAQCPDNEVKDLKLYIKPADNAVYYVINGLSAGMVSID